MEQTANLLQVSEISLVYRPSIKASQRLRIGKASDAYEIFMKSWDEDQIELLEHFKIMLLSRSNKVLGVSHIYSGGISGTIVDMKLIFGVALKSGASGLILAHNHPSSNLKASEADMVITRKIVNAAKLLDIEVLDHLIITDESYYSFADEGLL